MNLKKKEMLVVVKSDTIASVDALISAFENLSVRDDESVVNVRVVSSGVGEVNIEDVVMASIEVDTPASSAWGGGADLDDFVHTPTAIIAFNVGASGDAIREAGRVSRRIHYHNIIYDAIDVVESGMQECLSPTPEGSFLGKAVVQELFDIGGLGMVAGSKCIEGVIKRGAKVRWRPH